MGGLYDLDEPDDRWDGADDGTDHTDDSAAEDGPGSERDRARARRRALAGGAALALLALLLGLRWWAPTRPSEDPLPLPSTGVNAAGTAGNSAPANPPAAGPAPGSVAGGPSVPTFTGAVRAPGEGSDRSLRGSTPAATGLTPTGAQVAAVTAAAWLVAAYARSEDQRGWWSQVSPLLTPEARTAYAAVDPRRVTHTKVTGYAAVTPSAQSAAGGVLTIRVPTDAGPVDVDMVQREGTWLGQRIYFPSP